MMPLERLRTIANGIFFSLVSYGLRIFCCVSGLDSYAAGPGRFQSLTRQDSHKVQTIMNVVLRSLTNLDSDTAIWFLLKKSGFLSIHQMCAHSTLKTTYKILTTCQPEYLYQKLIEATQNVVRPRRQEASSRLSFKLALSRESFLYQASKLYSKLPPDLWATENFDVFKKKSKMWVKANIPIYM